MQILFRTSNIRSPENVWPVIICLAKTAAQPIAAVNPSAPGGTLTNTHAQLEAANCAGAEHLTLEDAPILLATWLSGLRGLSGGARSSPAIAIATARRSRPLTSQRSQAGRLQGTEHRERGDRAEPAAPGAEVGSGRVPGAAPELLPAGTAAQVTEG